MAVGFLVDCFDYEVGHADFLHSFFSTISKNLEPDGWGTRFPYLLGNLYHDKLNWSDVPMAIKETKTIQDELSELTKDDIVWDTPWGNNISSHITSPANYFVTSNGRDLFDVLFTALDVSLEENCDLIIRKL